MNERRGERRDERRDERQYRAATLAAQAMGVIDEATRAIVPPIHVATTYERDPDNQYRAGFIYGRPDNATVRLAERVIAMLEGAAAGALLFGSGMAAANTVLGALEAGDHVVAPEVMYWGLRARLRDLPRRGVSIDFVSMQDADAVRRAIRPGQTKLVWAETPANPLWTVTDLEAVAAIAHEGGARLAVDNTVASPFHMQPLALGADIVVHAATKILNGHSDVVAGAVAGATDDGFWQRIVAERSAGGAILGPFEAYLLLRGLRTFPLRARAQAVSAERLVRRLDAHPNVAEVLYPGLAGHPGHAIAHRQMTGGFGSMLSIRVAGGEAAAIGAAARVRLWHRATSLGGVESLIEHRASIEGPDTPCPPDLLRLSVGIEDVEDLYEDLDQALRGANR